MPSAVSSRQPLVPIFQVPLAHNAHFVGRELLLKHLDSSLHSEAMIKRVQVVCGLGGVGKTQVVAEYAYRHRMEYSIVWWVTADESATVAVNYARLAGRLNLRVESDTSLSAAHEAIKQFLDERDDWLLIFDNLGNPEQVKHLLPSGRRGHVLITSRNPNWAEVGESTLLKPLERAESIQFLRQRSGRKEPELSAGRVAQALGDLPLALAQAAATMEHAGISFGEYLKRFEEYWAELLKHPRPVADYPDSVAMSWELSLRQVAKSNSVAIDLLNFAAFLAPEEIGKNLLAGASDYLPQPLASVVADPVALEEAIAALARHSLVETGEKSIGVHRLVGALARDRRPLEQRVNWCRAAVHYIAANFKFDSQDLQSWPACDALLPHALAVANHAEALGQVPTVTAKLFNDVGWYLITRAQYALAREVLERALAIIERVYGAENPRISPIANNLGRVYRRLGETAKAQRLFERAMELDAASYGEAHPHVAEVANNLATVMHVDGQAPAALEQLQWALSVCEAHYGVEHPKVASIVNNVGYVMKHMGQVNLGQAYLARALAIAEAAYGPNHPQVASILGNLGVVLHSLGDSAGARKSFDRALAIDEATYGPNHPDVARDLGHLGELLSDLQDNSAALEYLKRALKIDESAYGETHPAVAGRLIELGRVHKAMGNVEESVACHERAAGILKQLREQTEKARLVGV